MVDHLDRLLEGEQTGQVVSGHFTGAVADYGIWTDPELRELLGQRDLNGEVGRLRDLRLRHARTGLIASELVEKRPVRVTGQFSVAALDAVGERGEDIQQPPAHLPPLGAHAGTHECQFRRGGVGAAGGDLPAVGEGLKLFSRIGDAVGDHGVTMVQMSASLAERVTQIRQRDIGVRGQIPGQPTGRRDQCFLAAGRDRQYGRRRRAGATRGAETARPGQAARRAPRGRWCRRIRTSSPRRRVARSRGTADPWRERRSSDPRETRVGSEFCRCRLAGM